MPDRKSLTSDCDPKPSATPTTPAPASSGATSTPISLSTMKHANSKTTKPATLRRMLVSALMRCSARKLVAVADSSRPPGARRRTAPSRSRTMPLDTLRIARSMIRPTSLLRISAPIAISAIVSGVPMRWSLASASAGLSVRSRISLQTALGSRPHVSRSSFAVMSASTKSTAPDASSRSPAATRGRSVAALAHRHPSQPLNTPI